MCRRRHKKGKETVKHTVYTRDKTKERTFTPALRALTKRAVNEALAFEEAEHVCEVSVTFVDREEIRTLNRDYREKDSVTDVLSFPTFDADEEIFVPEGESVPLGDVIICYDRCLEQAEEFGHSVEREVAYLTIHSVLHLLGYDHMVPDEEKEMTEKQDEIIKQVRLFPTK
ncbi:MAG: rRNA maturation RNase YbeY [Ruminococcaceae bacterium]|nr:rRNA maturation RNase YbeY [Oscillospiraceae bacterium]